MGCSACTEVEENYLDLETAVGLMYTVGEVVRRQAEKAHGPVRVHNFSLARARRRDSDMRSASSSTTSASSSIETGTSGDDENEPVDEETAKMAGGKQPGRLCNITAVVDWNTLPEAKDALADLDMLRLHDEECRELRAYLCSRSMSDLIVLEYSLEP